MCETGVGVAISAGDSILTIGSGIATGSGVLGLVGAAEDVWGPKEVTNLSTKLRKLLFYIFDKESSWTSMLQSTEWSIYLLNIFGLDRKGEIHDVLVRVRNLHFPRINDSFSGSNEQTLTHLLASVADDNTK